ncbi:ABC transporter permease [Actinomadura spongiicola]|uniref:ABC transporter permease n=1 Tax=Actinomadura spongiicola TaxID=2303421 RepID=A0A372GFD3_9ACTN|nr:ABC transporter permease [Actinomadura spongiicola]RFS84088.1 ABC transporter permease [Actinomadura spongiicola]
MTAPSADARSVAPPRLDGHPDGEARSASAAVRWGGLVVVTAALLAAWQILPSGVQGDGSSVPKLDAVLKALGPSGEWGEYLRALRTTLGEAFFGLLIGFVAGVVLGVLLGESRILRQGFYPYAVALQALPPIALAPIFVIWFGLGMESKIGLVGAATLFPILVSTMAGVAETDRGRIEMATAFGASRSQIRLKIVFPGLVVPIFSGLEISVVLSFLAAIAGELISANAGVGVILQVYQRDFRLAEEFAVLVILVAVGLALALLVRLARHFVLERMPNE